MLERNALTVCVLGLCLGLQAALMRRALQADAWYTLAAGRLVSRGLPRHDTLATISAGRRWVDQQWLGQLGIYELWRAGGIVTALLAGVILFGAAVVLAAASARMRGACDRSVALVLAVAFFAGLTDTALRAQAAAFVLFALVLALVLDDEVRPSRRLWLALPVLVVWANVHGSVLLGAGLVALRGLTEIIQALRARTGGGRHGLRGIGLLALPWICVLASPYALGLPGYYRSVLDNRSLSSASTEWAHSSLTGQPFFYALLAGGTLIGILGRRRLSAVGILAFAGTAALGVTAVRNDAWFALVSLAVLPPALDAVWRPAAAPRRRLVNLALACGSIGFALLLAAIVAARGTGWFERSFPPAAARAAAGAAHADPHAVIFANESFADWLVFEQPSLEGRVAFDIRYELLRPRELDRIVAFRRERGAGWQDVVRPYRLLVLGTKDDAGAIRLLKKRPGAKVLWKDAEITVLRQAVGS
jgi:hypothetical protein